MCQQKGIYDDVNARTEWKCQNKTMDKMEWNEIKEKTWKNTKCKWINRRNNKLTMSNAMHETREISWSQMERPL